MLLQRYTFRLLTQQIIIYNQVKSHYRLFAIMHNLTVIWQTAYPVIIKVVGQIRFQLCKRKSDKCAIYLAEIIH